MFNQPPRDPHTSHIRAAIDLFARGRIRLDPWVEEHPLGSGDRIFLEMLRQERNAVKAVLRP